MSENINDPGIRFVEDAVRFANSILSDEQITLSPAQFVNCRDIANAGPNICKDLGTLARETKRAEDNGKLAHDLGIQNAALLAENESLQRWKREATVVEAQWNPQAVARLLGIEWGRSIRAGIEPAVRQIQEQNAALSRQLAERQWQPIESAPRSAKAILVHCSERQNTYVVYNNGHWHHFGGFSRLTEEPTHWMPLPLPPGPEGVGA